MDLYVVDFETYYDDQFSLSKMSTEDYVTDPRFHLILVSIKKNDEKPKWFSGPFKEIFKWMYYEGVFNGAWCGHNAAMFDCLIGAAHFKFIPRMIFDTRLMAQAILKPYMRSVSLDSCLKHIELGIQKGTAVYNMKGCTRESLTAMDLAAYGRYGMDDVEGTYRLFKHLMPQFPRKELEIIDMTARMYLQPKLMLDAPLLAEILQETRAKKQALLNSLPASVTEKMLASNKQFAEVLQSLDIDPPTKISPTTGEITYAFSKNDPGFKELEEEYEDDPTVSAILAARLGVKSTIEESRTERLIHIANRYPSLRVPLLYYAAHTGRDGGMEKINLQNPPRIDKSRLRFAIKAPPGHAVLALDLAQIEARITALLAGQESLLEQFRNKEDPYARFASNAYKCDVKKGRSPEDDKMRFVGKTCILGLGFGMGWQKLRATLRKDGIKLDEREALHLVNTYRETFEEIYNLWGDFDRKLHLMAHGGTRLAYGPLYFARNCIILPNGMQLVYANLKYLDGNNKKNYRGWSYTFAGELRTLWGGKVTENSVQALARILVMDYALEIKHQYGYLPAMRVHDELVYVVPEERAAELAAAFMPIMRVPPEWAPDLPVEVEAHWGPTYGDCK